MDVPFYEISIVADESIHSAGHVGFAWGKSQVENAPTPLTLPCPHCDESLDTGSLASAFLTDAMMRNDADHAFNAIRILYAGGEAVKLLTGRRNLRGAASDYAQIQEVIDESLFYWSDTTRKAMLSALRFEASDLLRKNWMAVTALAEALLEQKSMSEADATKIVLMARKSKLLQAGRFYKVQ
jgi:hypothetical protein